mmetsp:Transcript_9691/g.16281  ORF Transcript_9691/g.16281 Transcript_9691/m.16281 type:complete len:92 (-) Transcript_9691:402-677(-)
MIIGDLAEEAFRACLACRAVGACLACLASREAAAFLFQAFHLCPSFPSEACPVEGACPEAASSHHLVAFHVQTFEDSGRGPWKVPQGLLLP